MATLITKKTGVDMLLCIYLITCKQSSYKHIRRYLHCFVAEANNDQRMTYVFLILAVSLVISNLHEKLPSHNTTFDIEEFSCY